MVNKLMNMIQELTEEERKELMRLMVNEHERQRYHNRTEEQNRRYRERKREYMREYRKKNKEKHNEYMKEYLKRKKQQRKVIDNRFQNGDNSVCAVI